MGGLPLYRSGAQKRPQVRLAGVFRYMCRRIPPGRGGGPCTRRQGRQSRAGQGAVSRTATSTGYFRQDRGPCGQYQVFCPGKQHTPDRKTGMASTRGDAQQDKEGQRSRQVSLTMVRHNRAPLSRSGEWGLMSSNGVPSSMSTCETWRMFPSRRSSGTRLMPMPPGR